jgi:hypothetical protein
MRTAYLLCISAALSLVTFGSVGAQEVRLTESFKPNHTTKVDVRVKVTGKIALPPTEKGKPGRVVSIEGTSTLIFEERVLAPDEVDTLKTIRVYREAAFERTQDGVKLEASIRPSVRRMVIYRPLELKDALARPVPFSPDGPLTFGELDVVRTDVFNPALIPGLLPPNAVKPGATWKAAAAAVAELTNLEKVDEGSLTIEFVGIVKPNGKQLARLKVGGTVRGVDEDGPSRQKLDGTAYFDLDAGLLTYLSLKGSREMLDGKGQTVGMREGQFAMTRTPVARMPADLSDASLRDLDLKTTPENTLLLYDNTDLGVRFLHPRGWHLGAVQGKQVTFDHARGSGLLITVESPAKVPTAEAYLKEVQADLEKQKITVTASEKPTRLRAEPVQLDRFAFDATVGTKKQRLEYAVLKQTDGGVTVAATLPADDADVRAEVMRIVRSLSVTKAIEEKK